LFRKTRLAENIAKLVGGTVLTATCVTATAIAQTVERVEVTGTRIKSPGIVSSSPISSIGSEEVLFSAPVVIEEVFRGLPAAVPAIGANTNNGSAGIATIDLRGLGPARTLVLINGRRAVPSDLYARVDTNIIPLSLIERVDLVTGGASAVYGADAVAGVVNFVMKRNFQGVDATSSYGLSEKGDAKRFRTDLTLGSNFAGNKGNVTMSFGTTKTDPLRQGERPFGEFQISSTNGLRGGSLTAAPATYGGIPAPLTGTRTIDSVSGQLRTAGQQDEYNFNPLNYYITPLDRTQATAIGRYTINDQAEVYAELFQTKSEVTLNLAPSGSFASAGFPAWFIPIGNPFIPDAVRQQLCAAYGISSNCAAGNPQEVRMNINRRFVENGPRIHNFANNTQQWTAGLRGELPFLSGWSYDGFIQAGESTQFSTRVNWGSASRFQQALRATNTASCTVTSGGCVPINVFGAPGTITPAMLGFINQTALLSTDVEQKVLSLAFNGELGPVKSPFANQPFSAAVGLEKREVTAGNLSDGPSQANGEVLGTGAPLPDRRGRIKLDESFIELNAPLVTNKPYARSMNFEGGYRDTKFGTVASDQKYGSWKYGIDWSPIKGLRFRAMEQRATRAPNVNELYQPVVTGLSNRANDPCQLAQINGGEANTAGTLSNLCRQTGVPTSQIGAVPAPSAGQISNTGGGNPNLGPEEADTRTVGMVWEPAFAPGLVMTLDYYKILIEKAVSSPTTSQVLDGCYLASLNPGLSASNPFCQLIQRNPVNGSLNGGNGVVTQQSNLGRVDTNGWDLGVAYRWNLENVGRIDASLNATVVDSNGFKSLPSVARIECAGFYGVDCGGPTYKVKFSQRSTWTWNAYSVGYNWRHLGGTDVQGNVASFLEGFRSIKAYNYFDVSLGWQPSKNTSLSMAIFNIGDLKPPMVGNTISTTTANSGNTFPQWYDVVGRQYRLGLTVRF
jgi:outer membrane receptor protein involved in Fe transport